MAPMMPPTTAPMPIPKISATAVGSWGPPGNSRVAKSAGCTREATMTATMHAKEPVDRSIPLERIANMTPKVRMPRMDPDSKIVQLNEEVII